MRTLLRSWTRLAWSMGLLACGGGSSASTSTTPPDAGSATLDASEGGAPSDGALDEADLAAPDAARDARTDAAGGGATNIAHVVLIVQENHSFDSYFGAWCTARSGSSPTCTQGPSCCEAAPATDPSGAPAKSLDDAENAGYDPNHTQSCELGEIDDGKMDKYVTGTSCSDARNFAVAPPSAIGPYATWAAQYAIADRWFQPIAGQSSSNDMFFAVGRYVFTDNAVQPDTSGKGCTLPPTPTAQYDGVTTIADLLVQRGHSFAVYAEGYRAMLTSLTCPSPPSDCTMTPFPLPTPPCDYSPGDIPFEFYRQFADNPTYMKDLDDLAADVQAGALPAFSYVKRVQYKNEHPGYGTTISNGTAAVSEVFSLIEQSKYANDTLVLLTWDESGGLFDHVAPPPVSSVDGQPYGPRVPTLALGRFARKGTVSHVVMEHASILKFLELNFLGATGQLGARDATAADIGSLLDPAETGIAVPEH